MKTGGPNVSILHLRSTSEPWRIANEEDNLARNLKLIFDMDACEFYRNNEQHGLIRENDSQLEPAAAVIKKQPLPLPRRYVNARNRSSVASNSELSDRQKNYAYFKHSNNKGIVEPGINDPHQLIIIEPPRRFSNECEKGSEKTKTAEKEASKSKPASASASAVAYYPILSPPPGFQDKEIQLLENRCENNCIAMMSNRAKVNCDCLPRARPYADCESQARSRIDLLSMRNAANYRNKAYSSTYNDKMTFDRSHYRRRMITDYPEYELGNRFKSTTQVPAPFNDQSAFSSWRSESDRFSDCSSQYSYNYKCYCNHCRVGSVPSTLSHHNRNVVVSDTSYPDVLDVPEYFISIPSPTTTDYVSETTPRRQKIRRAVSFQSRCASGADYPAANGNAEYRYNARISDMSRSLSRNRYVSFDDAYHEGRLRNNYISRSPNRCDFPLYYQPASDSNNKSSRYRSPPQQDCSCGYSSYSYNNAMKTGELRDSGRTNNTSAMSIPIAITQTRNHARYEYDDDDYDTTSTYPVSDTRQLYEEIYPANKERGSDEIVINPPPDIANISSSYSRLENHIYDPDFIRKQPDILQSSYYGNRSASSISADPNAACCRPNTSFRPQNNANNIDELKRKSHSLPKSFQRNDKMRSEFKSSDNPALIFHWRKHGVRGLLLNKKVVIPPSVMSETAPTTPVRDMPEKKKYGRLMKVGQYSSTPSLDDTSVKHINFDCDNRYRRDKYKSSKSVTINSAEFRPTSQENIVSSSNIGDRVFHKFCKSFSLRFLRKTSDAEDNDKTASSNKVFCEPAPPKKQHSNRFGPLAWRSSKERKGKINGVYDKSNEDGIQNLDEINQKEKSSVPKINYQHRIIRRTLSDLNGYHDVVKNKNLNVPTKYKPPVPMVSKKHRQYNLRRTASQPLFSSRFSPASERKCLASRAACSEDERTLFSEDEIMSDSGSSMPSRKNSLEQGINEEVVIYAEAVWDHVAIESEELPFSAGDVIEVYNVLDREWWWGMCNGKSGWFPSDFVRLRVNQEETFDNRLDSPTKLHASLSIYSNDQVRSKIVCELVNTEKDFVKVLKDVKEAFITECRKASELFTAEDVFKIFGNWEQILAFQIMLLENLDSSLDPLAPHKTCVGNSFIKFQEHFRMYSDYCNNHPLSIATLQQFYQKAEYRNFFEKCRIKKNLMEIPLDGFLLTPIQRICKYPLQLAELLKYTEEDHADYDAVRNALNAMREVAVLINERKRRMESLEKLILWQQRIEGWEGDNLIENSSQLIHQNDVTKVFAGVWSTNVTLFLFDHQLVFCKKDILKRDFYIYKGRISLDGCEVVDIADGKDSLLGINIRHGIKIQNIQKNKWLLFSCRTHKEKLEWLEAFKREKELVLLDERNKLQITPVDRHLAYITATTCNSRHTFLKHKNKKLKRSFHNNGHFSRNAGSPHILGRKVGTWFIFGANRKNHRRVNTKNQITAV